ncbi:glutaredoxin domain-containing protein [Amycolatopsis sp. QT-25]|uniref:glutaredoxin family protein n=1 Tax=Amycolatopsis sp. QT-25 TaxID=3034022 RepID=UPI0023EB7884|nr:glutaredoxin domain-containing protein [Amycolatopsis sp. QT-25]WET82508.1 glutaredoxin domain-containing protein [Amycolatopsis sp. QT-25]
MSDLTVYGAGWCPDVERSRALLDAKGIEYDYIDVEANTTAEKTVRALQNGERRIPTIVWPDGTHLVEPSDHELTTHLNR